MLILCTYREHCVRLYLWSAVEVHKQLFLCFLFFNTLYLEWVFFVLSFTVQPQADYRLWEIHIHHRRSTPLRFEAHWIDGRCVNQKVPIPLIIIEVQKSTLWIRFFICLVIYLFLSISIWNALSNKLHAGCDQYVNLSLHIPLIHGQFRLLPPFLPTSNIYDYALFIHDHRWAADRCRVQARINIDRYFYVLFPLFYGDHWLLCEYLSFIFNSIVNLPHALTEAAARNTDWADEPVAEPTTHKTTQLSVLWENGTWSQTNEPI